MGCGSRYKNLLLSGAIDTNIIYQRAGQSYESIHQ